MVLERNQGDRKTRVAAEPELQRDVQRLGGAALTRHARDRRLRRSTGRIQIQTSRALHQHKVVGVSDDGVQRANRARIRRKLGPDLHPVTILAVNALAANLNLNLLYEAVTDVVEPAETLLTTSISERVGSGGSSEGDLRENDLDVRLVHQICITIDNRRDTLVKVGLTVEGNFNGLYGEVGMALVQHLPEGDLGVARDVNVLRTIAHELHKSAAHIVFIPMVGKIF